MASAKRKQKQEEKNLTVLRVLASQPGNKECFDCHQRGPTYVNMTIGSFVCTSCSGMLRGLTPPHRVKSISMATFTQEEIDFIMERGNDYCRRVWLGLMNANQMPTMDTKDEQKMRDLMRAKYELKTYYLDPSKAGINNQNSSQKSQIGLSSLSSSSSPSLSNQLVNPTSPNPTTTIPKVPYSTFGSTAMTTTTKILPAPTNQKTKNNPENAINANNFTPDFIADFSKVPDPFVPPTQHCPKTVTSHHQSSIIPEPFFANFDNNPAFNDSPKGTTTMSPYNNIGGNMNMNGTTTTAPAPPSEDRYAALKDLDSLMKQTQLKDDTATTSPATPWNANNSIALNSVWGTNATNQNAHVISNPFTSGDLWRPSANIVNNNNTQPIMSNAYHHPPNPFKQMQFPLNNDAQWMGLGTSNNGDDFSKLMTPLPNKVWQPTVSAYHANPFMVGSGLSNMTRNSNNPFL